MMSGDCHRVPWTVGLSVAIGHGSDTNCKICSAEDGPARWLVVRDSASFEKDWTG